MKEFKTVATVALFVVMVFYVVGMAFVNISQSISIEKLEEKVNAIQTYTEADVRLFDAQADFNHEVSEAIKALREQPE